VPWKVPRQDPGLYGSWEELEVSDFLDGRISDDIIIKALLDDQRVDAADIVEGDLKDFMSKFVLFQILTIVGDFDNTDPNCEGHTLKTKCSFLDRDK
jgi:hypothetical protein